MDKKNHQTVKLFQVYVFCDSFNLVHTLNALLALAPNIDVNLRKKGVSLFLRLFLPTINAVFHVRLWH